MIELQKIAAYPQYVNFYCPKCGNYDTYMSDAVCYNCGARHLEIDMLFENATERIEYHKEGD